MALELAMAAASSFPLPISHCPALFVLFLLFPSLSSSASEAETLLAFKSTLPENPTFSSWDMKNPPCKGNVASWGGVICYGDSVWGLKLEKKGFRGKLDISSLANLPNLRTLSFMENEFEGPMPEINKIPALKMVYLSNNRFSGKIPDDAFKGMVWLKKLVMSQNQFSGPIPSSLTSLPKLFEVRIDGNHFEGPMPDAKQQHIKVFNVSNNALSGPVPESLSKLDISNFQGNQDMCGEPLEPCKSSPPPEPTPSTPRDANSPPSPSPPSSSKSSNSMLLIVIVLSVVALIALLVAALALRRRRQQQPNSIEGAAVAATPSNLQKKTGIKEEQCSPGPSDPSSMGRRVEAATKLSFVRDDREKFDLPELLKASAEILGSGCFGASYKAALTSGHVMVVKRFKQMNNVGKEEFHEHMRRLGRLNHANLLPLVAYYYRKDEKLLVNDFVHKGSLAVHLHGHQSLGQPSLDWPSRLKIVKGVARGLTYLYKELPSLIAPHGHLKSSNVLINESYEPLLTDYGLIPVINQESAQELMVAYKSPEYAQHGRVTKKTDIWSFGMLILEILTGRFPATFLKKGKGNDEDLAAWVNTMISEGHMEAIFDKDMTKVNEGEMTKLLDIALKCCQGDVENRLDLKEVVEKVEELKDPDEDFYSTVGDGDKKSSRGLSEDFDG